MTNPGGSIAHLGGAFDLLRETGQIDPARRLPRTIEIGVDQFTTLPFPQDLCEIFSRLGNPAYFIARG